jgi:hypothetical protein
LLLALIHDAKSNACVRHSGERLTDDRDSWNREETMRVLKMGWRSLPALLLSVFLAVEVAAVEPRAWIECTGAPVTMLERTPEPSDRSQLLVNDLLPGPAERWSRLFQVKAEFIDQEDFFVQEVRLPRGRDGEELDTLIFRPNPDSYLWKSTVSLDFSRLVWSADELKTAYEAAASNPEWFDTRVDPLALERAGNDLVEFFARARQEDRLDRFLNSLSAFVAIADRPTLRNGSLLPDAVDRDDEYDETYGVKIDTSRWFPNGSDWAKAYAATAAYARAFKQPSVLDFPHPCSGHVNRRCLEQATSLNGAQRLFASILPVFEFKLVDQFDFVQDGARFLSTDLADDSLETYTLTWDFARVFGAAKQRAEMLAALQALEKVREKGKPKIGWRSGTKIPVRAGELLYLQFESQGGLSPVKWSGDAEGCGSIAEGELLPGASLSKTTGLLTGYPAEIPARCRFSVRVADSLGQIASLACSVRQISSAGGGQGRL